MLIKNLFSLIIMQGTNYLIPLVTLPYLTRTLGGYNYGVLSTAIIFIQYMILFVDFGFDLSATKKISNNKSNKKMINVIYWNTIVSKIILFLVVFVVGFFSIYAIQKFHVILWVFVFLLPQVLGSVFFPVWFFQGLEKLTKISLLTIFSKLLTIPLLFFFVKESTDIQIAAFILGLPLFLSAMISFFFIHKLNILQPINFSSIYIFQTIKSSLPFFVGNAAISIYTLSTPIILSITSDFYEVGYYTAADKLRGAMLGLFLVLGRALYPRANSLFNKNKNEYNLFLRNVIFSQFILCSVGAAFFYLFVPDFAPFILGEEFTHSSLIIKAMAPMIFLVPASVIMANLIILPRGNNKLYALIHAFTAVVHVLYAFWFCYKWGAIGGGLSILITESVNFLLLLLVCWKKNYSPFNK